MGYSDDPTMVRVDFWKPSGKWYTTEAVRWTGRYDEGLIHEEFRKSLKDHFEGKSRLVGMTAICMKPYHKYKHPISIIVD